MDVPVGLEAGLQGLEPGCCWFGVAVCLSGGSSLPLSPVSGNKVAKSTSPLGSGQNKTVPSFLSL